MDVLRPPILRIGKRCYRKNPVNKFGEDEPYQEEDFYATEENTYMDEVCDAFTPIDETANGYRISLQIPSVYFKFIIGKKGETKRRIENETRTQIRIPRAGDEGDVVVDGRDKKGVISAKTRIDVLVDSGRQKQPFTHFLSFPVNAKAIKDSFEDFKSDVLRDCDGDRGLDATIFQNPNKLHLTIGTLVLVSDSEIDQASQVLHEWQEELIGPILEGYPLTCIFRGLEYMNDDPGMVDVLYAKVEPQDGSDRLQILADRLVDKFVAVGLMRQEYDRVKLHVTVMNTLMRKDPSGTTVPQSRDRRAVPKDRESFDASGVLRMFGNYNFGTLKMGEVHLSRRYSTGPDGYYAAASTLTLP